MNTEEDKKDENPDETETTETSEEQDPSEETEIVAEVTEEEDGDAAAEPEGEPVPPTYEELLSEIAALKDQLLRALAESENVRRRTEREKTDMSKYAITNFARQIVSVADNLFRALESVSEESRNANEELNNLFIGIELTGKEISNSFEQFGIKEIESTGKKFDHNLHQAMYEVDDPSQPAGMVVQEMQKGYTIHDRLLRPAMVGVSKGGPKLEDNGEEESPVEPPAEKVASNSSAAYEKQSEAADQVAEGGDSQIDKEL